MELWALEKEKGVQSEKQPWEGAGLETLFTGDGTAAEIG